MRLKLGLIIVVVFVLFLVLANVAVVEPLRGEAYDALTYKLTNGYENYRKARQAGQKERQEHVLKYASEKRLIELIDTLIEDEEQAKNQHFDLFESLEFLTQARYKGDLVIVVDKDGNELARTNTGKWFKSNNYLNAPLVAAALKKNKSGEDIWLFNKDQLIKEGQSGKAFDANGTKTMLVTAAPIISFDKTVGAILWCNEMGESFAKVETVLTPGEFGVFSPQRILGTTLNSSAEAELDDWIKSNQGRIGEVLTSHKPITLPISLGDTSWLVLFAPMKGFGDKVVAGFVMLESLDAMNAPFHQALLKMILITVILLLVITGLVLRDFNRLINSIDFILEGAHQVIMGNKDYQFKSTDPYLNSLGQTFNLMNAILQGKYIPEDEDDVVQQMKMGSGKNPISAQAMPKIIPDVLVKNLTETTEEAKEAVSETEQQDYYDGLYADFIKAKQELNEDTSRVTLDQFIQKLERAEQKLIERHGCKAVVFSITVEDGQVSFKPSPVWK